MTTPETSNIEAVRAATIKDYLTVQGVSKMQEPDIVDRIADILLEDHVALMNENKELREAYDAARSFFAWFNKNYPEPSNHPDHPWCVAGVKLRKIVVSDDALPDCPKGMVDTCCGDASRCRDIGGINDN